MSVAIISDDADIGDKIVKRFIDAGYCEEIVSSIEPAQIVDMLVGFRHNTAKRVHDDGSVFKKAELPEDISHDHDNIIMNTLDNIDWKIDTATSFMYAPDTEHIVINNADDLQNPEFIEKHLDTENTVVTFSISATTVVSIPAFVLASMQFGGENVPQDVCRFISQLAVFPGYVQFDKRGGLIVVVKLPCVIKRSMTMRDIADHVNQLGKIIMQVLPQIISMLPSVAATVTAAEKAASDPLENVVVPKDKTVWN